jgi:hypothetical protein
VISPDDEVDANGNDLLFVTRFNKLVDALIVESSVKLVARCAVDYAVRDGEGIYPGNEQLARKTSLHHGTVQRAWAILQGLDMAVMESRSYWTGRKRLANSYSLAIPERWRGWPVYGPHFARFTCGHCGKRFNPQPDTVLHPDGSIAWRLASMAFCPPPGRPKRKPGEGGRLKPKPASCFELWQRSGGKWPSGDGAWELFRQARNDDWPAPSQRAAA